MAPASQISHGALGRGRALGAVALMSPLVRWQWHGASAGMGWSKGSLSLWGCVSNSQVLPLDQALLPWVPLSSLLGACSGCPQHTDFYTSWLLLLTTLCFKTRVLVAVNEGSISC